MSKRHKHSADRSVPLEGPCDWEHVYGDGEDAYRLFKPLASCPYGPDQPTHRQTWLDGYEAAESDDIE